MRLEELVDQAGFAHARLAQQRDDLALTATRTGQRLLQEREPFYARAHLRIDTVGRAPGVVADEIVAAFEARKRSDRKES